MNKVLKDLTFGIAYLDDIIIYNKTGQEHLDHLQQVFKKLHYEIEQVPLLCQRNLIFGPCPQHYCHKTTTLQNVSYLANETHQKNTKHVQVFL